MLRGEADGIGREDGNLKVLDINGAIVLDKSHAAESQDQALEAIVDTIREYGVASPVAIGHRVVHGGPHLRKHQRISSDVLKALEAAVHFAPLHVPVALELIRKTEELLPDALQFACFDTAFHTTMPDTAYRYALPEELYRKGVQRYGFHGLSYESVLYRMGNKLPSRVVCAHLGSGASLAALHDGRSVDTSMGMTPTGGIPMATRVGDIDPGVLVFLMRNKGMTPDKLERLVNYQSGLGALSGGESDMRKLQAAAETGDERAKLAVEIFAGSVRKFIGAYAAELGGLDLLIFTGGIGEHSEFVRNLICRGLEFLGVNAQKYPASKVISIASEEEAQVARHSRRLMMEQDINRGKERWEVV